MLTETLDRYPNITFVLAHAGGFLPFAASRARTLAWAHYGIEEARFDDYLRRFYFDLALAGSSALPSLLAAVGPERVVFGTDWCAAGAEAVAKSTAALDASEHLRDADRALIDRDNAVRLLPELANRLSGVPR
jgi:predicted TIM-barrel fold metal-dependent hydrolase